MLGPLLCLLTDQTIMKAVEVAAYTGHFQISIVGFHRLSAEDFERTY